MTDVKALHVMVIFGGVSTEHKISCRSAYTIIRALKDAGCEVSPVGITESGQWLAYRADLESLLSGEWETAAVLAAGDHPTHLYGAPGYSVRDFLVSLAGGLPDVVYPAVHGINCEDGNLQGLLELSGIPYVGSGVTASALAMNKARCKSFLQAFDIPQVPHLVIDREQLSGGKKEDVLKQVATEIGFPCFLKPANGGSSVGTAAVQTAADLPVALAEVAQYDREIVVEAFVEARELELSILGNRDLTVAEVGEIVKAEDVLYYDYETKYLSADKGGISLPAKIDPALADRIRDLGVKIYRALDCSGLARVDFFLEQETGRLYFNEINTLPGFTRISIYPRALEQQGYPLPNLTKKLCELAIEAKAADGRRYLLPEPGPENEGQL